MTIKPHTISCRYKLAQVADLFCTLELLRLKLAAKSLSKSELRFFIAVKLLKKNYLFTLSRKLFI